MARNGAARDGWVWRGTVRSGLVRVISRMPLASYRTGVTFSGGLMLVDRRDLDRAIKLMPDGPGELSIKIGARSRSLRQNAYWWTKPVPLIAAHCGYTDHQMHYLLLGECFGYTHGSRGAVPVQPSSSALTVHEFSHLIEWVLTWAPTELGVIVPAPGEYEGVL